MAKGWLRSLRARVRRKNRDNREGRTWTVGASTVRVGRYTYGANLLEIRQWGEGASLDIGAFCSIADRVTVLLGGNHRVDWMTTYPFGALYPEDLGGESIVGHPATGGNVTIGNDVWVGTGAMILSGVTIGDGAVISARALVARDVAPYSIVGGNPARLLRLRFTAEVITELQRLRWWDWPTEKIRLAAPLLSGAPDADRLRQLREISD